MWVKLRTKSKGIAVNNFGIKDYHEPGILKLIIGDVVTILEECESGWYYGVKLDDEGNFLKGAFPVSCVKLISKSKSSKIDFNSSQLLKAKAKLRPTSYFDGICTTVISEANDDDSKEIIFHETYLLLKEWGIKLRKCLAEQKYEVFRKAHFEMTFVIKARKQLLSKELSKEELSQLYKEIFTSLRNTNHLLNIEDKSWCANTFTEKNFNSTSVLELLNEKCSVKRSSIMLDKPVYHILFDLKACIACIGSPSEYTVLYFSLFDARSNIFITDDYTVTLTFNGMPTNQDMIGKVKTLFCSLNASDLENRSLYLVCRIYRRGRMILANNEKAKLSTSSMIKRPFGVAIQHIKFNSKRDPMECFMKIYVPTQESNFYNLHQLIIENNGGFETQAKAEALSVGLQVLTGDRDELLSKYCKDASATQRYVQQLTSSVSEYAVKKPDFTYLQINLIGGEFNQGYKTSSKNVEICVQLRDNNDGSFIQDCFLCAESPDKFESSVQYHNNNPKWDERIKLQIPGSYYLENLHLFFTIRHCSSEKNNTVKENIFAFGYLPLMCDTDKVLCPDNNYKLTLFKYESTNAIPQVYLKQNWYPVQGIEEYFTEEIKYGAFFKKYISVCPDSPKYTEETFSRKMSVLNPNAGYKTSEKLRQINLQKLILQKDFLYVSTQFSSNEYSQCVFLSRLLFWTPGTNADTILRDFLQNVRASNVLNYAAKILDKLFQIASYSNQSNLVYKCLIHVFAILDKDSSENEFILKYLETATADAGPFLLEQLKLNLESSSVDVKDSMQVVQLITRFISRSYHLTSDKKSYKIKVDNILSGMSDYLGKDENLLENKVLLIQGYSTILTTLNNIFGSQQLSEYVISFCNSIPSGAEFAIEEIKLLNGIAKSTIFIYQQSTRDELMNFICSRIKAFLNLESHSIPLESIFDLVVDILCQLIGGYIEMMKITGTSCFSIRHISIILPELLSHYANTASDSSKGKLSGVILAIFQLVPSIGIADTDNPEKLIKHIFSFANSFFSGNFFDEKQSTLTSFSLQILLKVFQQSFNFLQMQHSQNDQENMIKSEMMARRAKRSSIYLQNRGSVSQVFSECLLAQLYVILIQYLKLFLKNESLYHYLIYSKKVEDLKSFAIQLMNQVSDLLLEGPSFPSFIELILPTLKISLFDHKSKVPRKDSKRNIDYIFMELFARLMAKEYRTTLSLKNFIIETLRFGWQNRDDLTESYIKYFDETLKKIISELNIKSIDKARTQLLEYFELIVELKSIPSHSSFAIEESYVRYKLMEFYKRIELTDLYLSQIHEMADSFVRSGKYNEAAQVLILHVQELSFDKNSILNPFREYPEQTELERKEQLYQTIIEYFATGKSYELALQYGKTLATVYEKHYEYTKLSKLHYKVGELYGYIASEQRYYCEYFRVGFYGQKFSKFFRNNQFIYAGLPFEKLSSFIERMLALHPEASLLKSNAPPSQELLESHSDMYIQIVSVKPYIEAEDDLNFEPNAEASLPEVLELFKANNDIRKFAYQRPIKLPDVTCVNEFSNLALEKVILETDYAFPNMRLSKIVDMRLVTISPFENAVLTVKAKTKELSKLCLKAQQNPKSVSSFTMCLNGAIDAAVSGGLKKYEEAFLQISNEDSAKQLLIKAIKNQVQMISTCLKVHDKLVSEELRPLHDRMVQFFANSSSDLAKYIT